MKGPGTSYLLLLLWISLAHVVRSQDVTLPPRPVLPFQQDAQPNVTDEQLAIQFYQSRDFVKAAELFERIYDSRPSYYVYQYLVMALVENQEYGKAEKIVRKCLKAEPDSPRYLVDLGYILYRSGNPDKARKTYEEALKKLAPSQQSIFDLANAFMMKGENEYAIQTYLKGRQLMNNTYPFGFELAGVYERMGDFKSATEEYLNLLEFNETYLNTIQDRIQGLLSFDVNNEKNEILRKVLLSRVQKNPDKVVYASLLWWYSIQQKDFDLALIQAKALDRRLKESGDKLVQVANLALSNQQFDVAESAFQALIDKGGSSPYYNYSRRELINTRYRKILSGPSPKKQELENLTGSMVKELKDSGESPENITLIRNFAHLEGFYNHRTDSAISLLNRAILMAGISNEDKAYCKMELADIFLFTGEVWEATLLYQQVYQDYKNDVLGQEAKFKNTKLSFYIGEFMWARAQADILKAATSKFIANDALALSLLIGENLDPDSSTVALEKYARADLLDFRNEPGLALQSLDSILTTFVEHPIFQYVFYKKAVIKLKQGKFAEADSLLELLFSLYPEGVLADEALMQRGDLNQNQLNNPVKAMDCYREIIDKYPASIFVPEARRQFRKLRGDNIP